MNRVLRRPMFRLGGSAEGITSGLDGPSINASRQGYSFGGKTLQQMGVSQEFINSNSHLDDKGIFRKWRMENREILPSGEDITIDELADLMDGDFEAISRCMVVFAEQMGGSEKKQKAKKK